MALSDPQTPRPGRDPRVAAYAVLLVLSTGIAFFSAAAILATRDQLFRVFAHAGATLPAPTLWFAGPWAPTLLVAAAILTLAKESYPSLRGISVLWNALALLGSLAMLGLYVLSMFAPLISIIRAG